MRALLHLKQLVGGSQLGVGLKHLGMCVETKRMEALGIIYLGQPTLFCLKDDVFFNLFGFVFLVVCFYGLKKPWLF